MITSYNLQNNTYSEQKFTQDIIEKLPLENEGVTALVDGAYYSEYIANKAKGKDIKIVSTNLIGRSEASDYEKFEIDEKRHVVKRYPSGHKPININFKQGSHRAHFDKKHCKYCPLRKDCPVI